MQNCSTALANTLQYITRLVPNTGFIVLEISVTALEELCSNACCAMWVAVFELRSMAICLSMCQCRCNSKRPHAGDGKSYNVHCCTLKAQQVSYLTTFNCLCFCMLFGDVQLPSFNDLSWVSGVGALMSLASVQLTAV